MARIPHRLLSSLLVGALVVVACGDDDDAPDDVVADEASPADDGAAVDGGGTPDASGTDEPDPDGPGEGASAGDEPAASDDGEDDPAEPEVPTDQPAVEPDDPGDPDEGGDPFVVVTELTGDAEVPGPGDAAATGRFEMEIATFDEACFDMVVDAHEGSVTGAHIHAAPAGEAGSVVVDLGDPTGVDAEGSAWVDVCIAVDEAFVDELVADESQFYVNVHTDVFPDGAVRGQLEAATIFDLEL